MTQLTHEDALEYSEAGQQVAQGAYRQAALGVRLGAPKALGLSNREWVSKYYGYEKVPVETRRERVKELTEEGLTQREAADVLGVSQKTVDRDLESFDSPEPEATPEPESNDSQQPSTDIVEAELVESLDDPTPAELDDIRARKADQKKETKRKANAFFVKVGAQVVVDSLAQAKDATTDLLERLDNPEDIIYARQEIRKLIQDLLTLVGED